MQQFLINATNWILKKEQEAANNCKISVEDIDQQITYMETKRDKYKLDFEDNLSEIEHVLNKLHEVKAKAMKCDV